MTERQGGSDVRANETTARPDGDAWVLDGHKWFCSAPMSDAFLVLAQAPAGLSCFLLERPQPGFRIERLKDKLGNRSNASAEIALDGAVADARRRGGPRRPDDPRDGQPHAARLRARLGCPDAPRRRGGDAPRRAPRRLRTAAGRAAADAERPRRPLRRERGGDRDGAAAGARLRRGGRPVPPPRDRGREVLGLQAHAAARRARRSSASAATATSRSRSCRGSSARARSTRSGRAPGTSTRSTSSARSPASPRRPRRSSPRCGSPPGRTRASTPRSAGSSASWREPEEQSARRLLELLAVSLQGSLLVRHGAPEVADAFCARLERPGGVYGTLPSVRRPRGDRRAFHAAPPPGRLRPWPSRSTTAPSEAATTAGPRVSRPS